MEIERLRALSKQQFLSGYVGQNRPVVVSDALDGWRLQEVWTPEYLAHLLGKQVVQVYNSCFDLLCLIPLEKYFEKHFGNSAELSGVVPYVRWYTKLRDIDDDFPWGDRVFDVIRQNWGAPYFVPDTDYVLPWSPSPAKVDPASHSFPARGLFVSGRGAKTGLHCDPWGSDAILCQLYGAKTWLMYAPDQATWLTNGSAVVDPDQPDLRRFPFFGEAVSTYEFTIGPGDAVYIPHGWYHHVRTDTDSISLTWNFVHATTRGKFTEWLKGKISDIDASVLRFFFASSLGPKAVPAEIEELVRKTYG